VALVCWVEVAVVESAQPGGAHVSCESPLTHPDFVLEVGGGRSECLVGVAVVLSIVSCLAIECLVVVVVNHDLVGVVVAEEIVPSVGVVNEGVVENEVGLWRVLLDHRPHLPVELLECREVRVLPGLVHGLEGCEGAVLAPSLEEPLRNAQTPLEVLEVKFVSFLGLVVDAHPLSVAEGPVLEVLSVGPLDVPSLTAVIEAILRVLHGVDV